MKHNYLNNKDILKEIHKSKTSYCSYATQADADYDMIVPDLKHITKKAIKEAKELRAEKLAKLAHEQATSGGEKRKLEEFAVKSSSIQTEDLVFRVTMWSHIPLAENKKAIDLDEDDSFEDLDPPVVIKTSAKYVKVNFPPFQHFRINDEGELTCVGKSHWYGDLDEGYFSKDHGKMTNKLAHMFIKLCDRYATRANWRGYTYNDEMKGQALLQLSQIGLQFDESKSSNPFAYYTSVVVNSFTRVLNTEKRNQNIRDDILEMHNYNPSYTRQGMRSGSDSYDE